MQPSQTRMKEDRLNCTEIQPSHCRSINCQKLLALSSHYSMIFLITAIIINTAFSVPRENSVCEILRAV